MTPEQTEAYRIFKLFIDEDKYKNVSRRALKTATKNAIICVNEKIASIDKVPTPLGTHGDELYLMLLVKKELEKR